MVSYFYIYDNLSYEIRFFINLVFVLFLFILFLVYKHNLRHYPKNLKCCQKWPEIDKDQIIYWRKLIYDRSTNSVAFLHYSDVFTTHLPFNATQIIKFFLTSRVSFTIKGWDFSQSGNPYSP